MRPKKTTRKGKSKIKKFRLWTILGTAAIVIFYLFAAVDFVAKTTDVNAAGSVPRNEKILQSSPPQQQQCYPTTSYSLVQIDPVSRAVILKSHYDDGLKEKTMGGDEFYPTVVFNNNNNDNTSSGTNEQVIGVGRVSDLSNGQYAVVFESLVALESFVNEYAANADAATPFYNISLLGDGFSLRTILQYSCGDGILPPPSKEFRPDNGAINTELPIRYPLSTWWPMKKPPTKKSQQPQIDLKKFDRVLALGDSLMRQLVHGGLYAKREVAPPWTFRIIQAPLSSDTMEQAFLEPARKFCKNATTGNIFLGTEIDRLSMPAEGACSTNRTLLLLNSGVWDLLEDGSLRFPSISKTCCDYDTDFVNHLESLRNLLVSIRRHFPNVTIGWKSMTATHVHRVECGTKPTSCIRRVKYMSSSRSERLFEKQRTLLEDEFPGVLFVNTYDLTYSLAHHSVPGDGRHYLCPDGHGQGINVCLDTWNEAFGDSGWA